MNTAINTATERFLKAAGEYAMHPRMSLSTVMPNGTVILRNGRGLLAIVTATGKVFDRIGGIRLDEVSA